MVILSVNAKFKPGSVKQNFGREKEEIWIGLMTKASTPKENPQKQL